MKTFLYIDVFNLYYSAVKDTPHKWLNPLLLASSRIPPKYLLSCSLLHGPRPPGLHLQQGLHSQCQKFGIRPAQGEDDRGRHSKGKQPGIGI